MLHKAIHIKSITGGTETKLTTTNYECSGEDSYKLLWSLFSNPLFSCCVCIYVVYMNKLVFKPTMSVDFYWYIHMKQENG